MSITLEKFIEEGRAYSNELCKRGCSETYMDSLYFGYCETNMRDILGIDYKVEIRNPETDELITMTKEQFQQYLDEVGEIAYTQVRIIVQ